MTSEELRAKLAEAAAVDQEWNLRNAPYLHQVHLFVGPDQDGCARAVNLKAGTYDRWVLEDDFERPGLIQDPNGTGQLVDRGNVSSGGRAIKVRAGKMVTETVAVRFRLVDKATQETVWSNE